jgi:predicted  nucleic acid-binding Zn-ribbon protein
MAAGSASVSAAPATPTALTPAGQQLEAAYAEQLKALQAEISKVVPSVDEGKNSALQAAREAVKKAKSDIAAAQQPLDKITGAAGLVGHRKNKWIAGANKGIAAAEAALKAATTDAQREAAKKDLAHWQENLKAGEKALVESQAALDAAKEDEPKYIQARKAAQIALDDAIANELKAAKSLLASVEPFLASDKLDAKLSKCAVLSDATPKGLAEFAQQGKERESLVEKLLADTAMMKAMLAAGGAKSGKFGEAMEVYTGIQKASPRAKDGVLQRLALAISLEHAVPAVVDPVKRYLHFEKAHLGGELDPAFKDMSVWELRNVVNGDESDEMLAWGREMLRNYRPDHILNPDYGWRYSAAVTTDVKYGSQNVKDDLPELQRYQNIIKNGGVCGRRAFFGRFILRCFGIPTLARPQRGHAALARWTPNGWVINLGAGWGSPDAQGVMEMTDADFVLETQARKRPAEYEKALRACWAGDALGQPKYVSMKPDSGGWWSNLAQFQKMAIVADVKPVQLAARGTELGEANESAEAKARALVKAEVTEADKKVAVGPNGVITIPAAACGGAQILGSFGGGHQLFSGSGAITFEIEVPGTGNYALTARVATVQDNPKLLLTANDAKEAVEIAVPYTIGMWQQTPPAQLTLAKGKNNLRLSRPEGSRGLAIKEFTLTPVK